jgi:hypothetical protein
MGDSPFGAQKRKKGSGVLFTYKKMEDSFVNKTPAPFFGAAMGDSPFENRNDTLSTARRFSDAIHDASESDQGI